MTHSMHEPGPYQIVIAEDNLADVMLVRQAFKEHRINCTVHVIADGEQALKFFDGAGPTHPRVDLLVLDLNLPKHDGEEILNRLRATTRYANLPVVVMTAMNEYAPVMTRISEIASDCFAKPSSLDEFLRLGEIVRNLLRGSDGRSERGERFTAAESGV